MKYIVTKEIKSEQQVIWKLYVQDFLFIVVYCAWAMLMKGKVQESVRVVYGIFSLIMVIILVLPSTSNPKRRNYQSIVLYFQSPKCVFKCMETEVENGSDEISKKKKRR